MKSLSLRLCIFYTLVGTILGLGIAHFVLPEPEPRIEYKYVEVEKKEVKKTTKIDKKPDGTQHIEIVEESRTDSKKGISLDSTPKSKVLGLYLGTGVRSDLLQFGIVPDKILVSGLITYDNYGLSVYSDLDKEHGFFIYYGRTF